MNTEFFERIFRNSNTVIIETLTSAGEPIVSTTSNVEVLLGVTADELVNKACLFDDLIHQDDIAQYLLESQQGALSSECDEIVHQPFRFLHQEGYEVWVKDAAQVIRFNGNVEKIVHIITDVTREKQETQELAEQKHRLLNVLQSAGFGLWEWNTRYDSLECDKNWSSLIGFANPIERMKISRLFALVHPDDLTVFKQSIYDLGSGQSNSFNMVVRIRHMSGKMRYHACSGNSLPIGYSSDFLVSVSHYDLTEQKENELSAIASLTARNQFFARVSHEIRTPLHGILGMLGLLKQDKLSDSSIEKVDKVIYSSEQLLFLLNDILDLAKLNEAKLKVSIEPCSLSQIMNQVSRLFIQKAQEKSLSFVNEVPEPHFDLIMTDKVRLTQVLSNLVSNAIKFTHMGSVKISAQLKNTNIVLSVKDSGVGIKNTNDIFEAYQQETNFHSKFNEGTGLGLEIVKRLCDLLDIDISLTSSELGTMFHLNLGKPIDNDQTKIGLNLEINTPDISLQQVSVLIVDDSEINREILKESLQSHGVSCEEAADGYQAIKKVDEMNSFDVILMDKHMPNMDGIEATKRIRDNTKLASQPVIIALTADAFDVDSEKWFELGVDEIITKPFEIDDLLMSINNCMKNMASGYIE